MRIAAAALSALFVALIAVHAPPSVSAQAIAPSATGTAGTVAGAVVDAADGAPLPGATVRLNASVAMTDSAGAFALTGVSAGTHTLHARATGYQSARKTVRVQAGDTVRVTFRLPPSTQPDNELMLGRPIQVRSQAADGALYGPGPPHRPDWNTEDYAPIEANAFQAVADHPLSTFAIDVDGASYTNARRFIRDGQRPPKDAVRIEELLNYFQYEYPAPSATDEHPFQATMEAAPAPWRPNHTLVHIGLQGERIPVAERPPSNLVFLLDVSGSMQSRDKLPLLKRGFRLLADQLRPEDRVAIVVYAGASGLVLASTPGSETDSIKQAIEQLRAGGSTAGAAGIQQAYAVAEEHFIEGGINRVILATDGDFNVGVSSDGALQRLIEEKRDGGTMLTVLGFGTGNLKDNKMETLANHGNGNYYYIDSATEARRVLVEELGSTLHTIAKDVKVQVEFNPAEVRAYRLIGYVNRALDDEDFADDSTDAGELGAGHSVTALYEVIRRGADTDVEIPMADSLKYQQPRPTGAAATSGELLTLKLRYKAPDGDTSRLIEQPLHRSVLEQAVSGDFHFAAAVAGFGMLLRDSEYAGTLTLDDVRALAERGRGSDPNGTRAGFIALVEDSRGLLGEDGDVSASSER